MSEEVRPSEKLDKEMRDRMERGLAAAVLAAPADSEGLLSDLRCLNVRRLLQRALAAEVDDYLGRDYYGRGQRLHPGLRNGYEAPPT